MKDGWSTGPCVNNSHSQSRGNPGTIFPPGCVLVAGWSAEVITSAAKRSIGFTIGFHNHGEGPYWGLLLVESAY